MTRDPMTVMFGPSRCTACGKDHYVGPCPPPREYVPPRIVSPHRHHGHHPWAQPGDRPDRVWLLRFDDTDRRDMIWTGGDAETLAVEAYRLYAPTWNCTLLASVAAADLSPPAESSLGDGTGRDPSPRKAARDEPESLPEAEGYTITRGNP